MKEILVSGNPTKDFERLGVNPILTYGDDETEYRVYEVSDEDFQVLINEPDSEEIDGIWEDCGWRYCEGSNQGTPNATLKINNKELKCWLENVFEDDKESYIPSYNNLLNYLCEEMGISEFRNVCALAKDLAKYNGIKMSELFKIYQDKK